jgi:hypothetical protein
MKMSAWPFIAVGLLSFLGGAWWLWNSEPWLEGPVSRVIRATPVSILDYGERLQTVLPDGLPAEEAIARLEAEGFACNRVTRREYTPYDLACTRYPRGLFDWPIVCQKGWFLHFHLDAQDRIVSRSGRTYQRCL